MKTQIENCKMQIAKIMALTVLFLSGCCHLFDTTPPAVPKGVVSVTGDECVTLYWYPNSENDLEGYFIYRSYCPEGPYKAIGSSRSAFFIDDYVSNGETYYYAVSAYDYDGNESDISYEMVFDTPRPEGRGVRLWDANNYELDAGYDFSREMVQAWDESSTDIYCISDAGIFYMTAADEQTDIQDFGYMDELDDINYAPEDGWSETGVVELIQGHGYIVWTNNNHFAKFRITSIGDEYVKFDWAYQIDKGNRELSVRERQDRNMECGSLLLQKSYDAAKASFCTPKRKEEK